MVIVFNAIWGHTELSLQDCQELHCQHNITEMERVASKCWNYAARRGRVLQCFEKP